jgi:hypothetical protein
MGSHRLQQETLELISKKKEIPISYGMFSACPLRKMPKKRPKGITEAICMDGDGGKLKQNTLG